MLPGASTQLRSDDALELYSAGAAFSDDPKASVFVAGGRRLAEGFGLVGGVRYDVVDGELISFMDARDAMRDKLAVLNEQQPFVGHVNRRIVAAPPEPRPRLVRRFPRPAPVRPSPPTVERTLRRGGGGYDADDSVSLHYGDVD